MTFDPARNSHPLWTPSGDRVVFTSDRVEPPGLFWKAADGTGEVEPLFSMPGRVVVATSWSGDGRRLLVTSREFGSDFVFDVGFISMGGEPAYHPLLAESHDEGTARISPDGGWMAYQYGSGDGPGVYVRPFPEVERGRWFVGQGGKPLWSPDGRELYYRTPAPRIGVRQMIAVPIETEPSFSVGVAETLFEDVFYPAGASGYDVASDGRFLMVKDADVPAAEGRQINIGAQLVGGAEGAGAPKLAAQL